MRNVLYVTFQGNETTNNELMGKSFPNVTAAVMEKLEEREEFHRNEKK